MASGSLLWTVVGTLMVLAGGAVVIISKQIYFRHCRQIGTRLAQEVENRRLEWVILKGDPPMPVMTHLLFRTGWLVVLIGAVVFVFSGLAAIIVFVQN